MPSVLIRKKKLMTQRRYAGRVNTKKILQNSFIFELHDISLQLYDRRRRRKYLYNIILILKSGSWSLSLLLSLTLVIELQLAGEALRSTQQYNNNNIKKRKLRNTSLMKSCKEQGERERERRKRKRR
jgi:hypothetical protein